MNDPKVSILIPVYNRETLIEETVRSAINQTYKDYEIVIVDNCSTDRTHEILQELAEKYDKIKLFRNQTNLGPVENWKKCIEYARGLYVKILWSDDLIRQDFLQITVPILETSGDVGFVYSGVVIFSENFRKNAYRLGRTGYYNSTVFLEGAILDKYSTPVSPGCALFKKNEIKIYDHIPNRLGLEHSKTGAGIDLLIFLQTFGTHSKFYYVDEELCSFRSHNDSLTVANELSQQYLTAKFFYLKGSNYKNYLELLNTKIFIEECIQERKIIKPKDILSKYYTEQEISKYNSLLTVKIFPYILSRFMKKILHRGSEWGGKFSSFLAVSK